MIGENMTIKIKEIEITIESKEDLKKIQEVTTKTIDEKLNELTREFKITCQN